MRTRFVDLSPFSKQLAPIGVVGPLHVLLIVAKGFQSLVDAATCVRLASIKEGKLYILLRRPSSEKRSAWRIISQALYLLINCEWRRGQPSDREGGDVVRYIKSVLNHTSLLLHVRFSSFAFER